MRPRFGILNLILFWGLGHLKRKLFLTGLQNSGHDNLLPSPTEMVQPVHEGEECLLSPVVFQLPSLTTAPVLTSPLLHRTRAATEQKELGATCLIYSPPAAERPEVVYFRVSTSSLTPLSHNHWPRPITNQNAVVH